MELKKIFFNDNPETKEDAVPKELPPDDGHQMSQSEIDDLIAQLLNK